MPVRPEEKIRCSFCGKNQDQVRKMIAGTNGVYICDECIELCSEILEEELGNEEEERPDFSGINLLKPKEIKEFLDDYVIGQDEAKKVLSVEFTIIIRESHRRWKVMLIFRRATS